MKWKDDKEKKKEKLDVFVDMLYAVL